MFLLRHTANDKDFLTDDACRTSSTCAARRSTCRRPARRRSSPSTSPCRACSSFECDLALAGGVDDRGAPPRRLRVPGGRDPLARRRTAGRSTSGRRARCSRAASGVVALRRLADAHRRRRPDPRRRSRARPINNDGQRKVGYLAPSVDGHADVVKEALAVAGLSGPRHPAARGPRHRHRRRRPDRGRRARPRRSGRRPPTPASAGSCRRSRTSATSTPRPASPA